jgi:hypothetical protein
MIADVVVFVAGAALVMSIMLSAIRTVVLPSGGSVRLTRSIFRNGRRVAHLYARVDRSPSRRHAAMQHSVAIGLLSLPMIWLGTAVIGFTMMFKGFGTDSWRASYDLAGSSMFTLGFAKADDLPRLTLSFVGAALAISILALLLVTYLPTIYTAYTAREAKLTSFEAIAGDPPNVVAMTIRMWEIGSLDRLQTLWVGWREWFGDLRESHTALPAIAFLGSSRPDRNWVATVGTFLDAAAVSLAVLDRPVDPDAALAIRSGSLALCDIAEYFDLKVDRNPSPGDPISVTRARFDMGYDQMVAAGVPVVGRDEAWEHWSGWRVNYDAALVQLAELTAGSTVRFAEGATYG